MGKEFPPPLTQSELNGAADAAAAIVTRCNMVPEDGFVGPEDMLDLMYRKFTRGVTLKLDLEGLCASLAHPSILELRGFKFQHYKGVNDHLAAADKRFGCIALVAVSTTASCLPQDRQKSVIKYGPYGIQCEAMVRTTEHMLVHPPRWPRDPQPAALRLSHLPVRQVPLPSPIPTMMVMM